MVAFAQIMPHLNVIKQWYLHGVERVDQDNPPVDTLVEDILQADIPVLEDNLVADTLVEEGILRVLDHTVPEDIDLQKETALLEDTVLPEDVVLREDIVHTYPFHLPFFSST
ncbi:hypothetical protein H5410_039746 [Solanum commersonii]|uniref:Uncharacterized protein n=1 Tax=Solanum commersonii TaxID=4109 RepID=A0A9J5XQ45_SOLCO|nr:hypothetical protein H5410_039746 [Solanum commersonii]